MKTVHIDLAAPLGTVKPLNGVNNGPLPCRADQTKTNFDSFKAARFPFVRNHDASLCSAYGGEHTVDITAVFPDFDADVNDPASYDFVLTDEYTLRCIDAGAEILYRLGQHIEHTTKKYYTLPPKDFHKWAEICEHIIRHFNEGFADGYHLGIRYWEIWNEPDLDADDSPNKRCWGGTKAQFFDLYEITAKHLKSRFPDLMIGGPSLAHDLHWGEDFLKEMQKRNVPLDFFSWHRYGTNVQSIVKRTEDIRGLLDRHGYKNAESVFAEWNYVRGWGKDWIYSIQMMNGQKGAAFCTAVMAALQYAPVDIATYYDARPGVMNGLFDFYTALPGKVYAPFYRFSDLAQLGKAVKVDSDSDTVFAVAAENETRAAVLLTHYAENDETPSETVRLCFDGLDQPKTVEFYRLNDETDGPFLSAVLTPDAPDLSLTLSLFEIDCITLSNEGVEV